MRDLVQAIENAENVETLSRTCDSFLQAKFLKEINSPLVISLLPSFTDPLKAAVVTLFKLELRIWHSSYPLDHGKIQEDLNSLENLNTINQASSSLALLLKGKYQDLLTDYYLCFLDSSKRPRLVDLINKKLNILKLVSTSKHMTANLQFKILLFYLLCEADLRKRKVHHYLQEVGVYAKKLNEIVKTYVKFTNGRSLVPLYVYNELTAHLKSHYALFLCLLNRFDGVFLEYFFENNIQRLPRCFKSIKFERICTLLTEQPQNIDIEDLLFRMIIGRQLPDGTQIDQARQLVIFGARVEKYDAINSRIKRIGELVESLAT